MKNNKIRRFIEKRNLNAKRSKVFLVHGRDQEGAAWIRGCLEQLDVFVLSWESAMSLTASGAPYILDVVRAGMRASDACVVLFTPDEAVSLSDNLVGADEDSQSGFQARPNVWIEAGMAIAMNPNSVVLIEADGCRSASDLHGVHFLRYKSTSDRMEFLNLLQNRLRSAGCRAKLLI